MAYTYAGQYGPEPLFDTAGHLLPHTSVTVYIGTTQVTLATLYTDRTKGVQAANPVTADAYGNLSFFADPGVYTIVANGTALVVLVPRDTQEPIVQGLTTKGDLAVYSGTGSGEGAMMAVHPGTAGQLLVSDSTQATGFHWDTFVPSSGGTFTGPVTALDLRASGLSGTSGARHFVGLVSGAPPTTGTFQTNDEVLDTQGGSWICTAGGSPGTWTRQVKSRTTSFTASGTWVCPPGITEVVVLLVGGGGGGGSGVSSSYYSGYGGAGGVVVMQRVAVVPGTTYVITIGAGGVGGVVSAGNGGTGGTSTFAVQSGATLLSAVGGFYGSSPNGNFINTPTPGGTSSFILPAANSQQAPSSAGIAVTAFMTPQCGGIVYQTSSTTAGIGGGAPVLGYGAGGGAGSNTSTSGSGWPGQAAGVGTGIGGTGGGAAGVSPGTGGNGGTAAANTGHGGGGGSNFYGGTAFSGGPGGSGYCEIRAVY